MQSDTHTAFVSKKMLWAGYIISVLPVLMLLFSGVMKLMKPASVVEGFVRLGYPEGLALRDRGRRAGLCCPVCDSADFSSRGDPADGLSRRRNCYPCAIGEPFFAPIVLGVLVWGGLFLREARLRALLPLRG